MIEVWGITGLMGAGKSTALSILKEKGFEVVDADLVAHQVVDIASEDGRKTLALLAQHFGQEILSSTGSLDRGRLAALISQNPSQREDLEKLLHPKIVHVLREKIVLWTFQNKRMAFVEGTRLVESGYSRELKGMILVSASPELRLSRIIARGNMNIETAKKLISLQDENQMRQNSQVTWENNSSLEELKLQIESFVKERQKR